LTDPLPPASLRIRDAQPGDLAAICEFNIRLAAETESTALDRSLLERGVARALAHPEGLRYWVAEARADGLPQAGLIGQAAVSREWSDWRNGWIWWFQSVYVHPDHRRQGVFRALHQAIKAGAFAAGDVIGLRLYVEHANFAAQHTYEALGLRPGGYHVYEDLWTPAQRTAERASE
jgi:GNAT superfamily N-acetyltransferase